MGKTFKMGAHLLARWFKPFQDLLGSLQGSSWPSSRLCFHGLLFICICRLLYPCLGHASTLCLTVFMLCRSWNVIKLLRRHLFKLRRARSGRHSLRWLMWPGAE